jgi:hypothetical protein
MKTLLTLCILLCEFIPLARAQYPRPAPTPYYRPLSAPQMDQLLGPIALYPDPLIGQILPAATLPAQIVMADRYVSSGGDLNQIAYQSWDASVQALARYPTVLKWMDDNLNWTTQVGQVFLNQQPDVMDSIQRLRRTARNLGNLRSTPQQRIVEYGGVIEILPANPQVIYVPSYAPERVYYQRGPTISFGIGLSIGAWLNHDFDWGNHRIVEWSREHPRPSTWWRERGEHRPGGFDRRTTVWRPEQHRDYDRFDRRDRGWDNRAPERRERDEGHSSLPIPAPPGLPLPGLPVPGRGAPSGPLIGVQSSRETREYRERGEQSLKSAPHIGPLPLPPLPFGLGRRDRDKD